MNIFRIYNEYTFYICISIIIRCLCILRYIIRCDTRCIKIKNLFTIRFTIWQLCIHTHKYSIPIVNWEWNSKLVSAHHKSKRNKIRLCLDWSQFKIRVLWNFFKILMCSILLRNFKGTTKYTLFSQHPYFEGSRSSRFPRILYQMDFLKS